MFLGEKQDGDNFKKNQKLSLFFFVQFDISQKSLQKGEK
jgi:hypothetical protein